MRGIARGKSVQRRGCLAPQPSGGRFGWFEGVAFIDGRGRRHRWGRSVAVGWGFENDDENAAGVMGSRVEERAQGVEGFKSGHHGSVGDLREK